MKESKNKKVLSIETTGKICGVAIADCNKILIEKNIDNGLTHSVTLFNLIDNVLKSSCVRPNDLTSICVSAGPGSFTGIRIGIAAALGIAKPFNTKISYVDTLDSLAYNVKDKANIIISMMDARADRVFVSIYDGKTLKKLLNDGIYKINDIIENINKYFKNKNVPFIFVGDGAIKYEDKLNNNLMIKYKIASKNDILQKASSLIFANGKFSKNVSINYMLKSKAERDMAHDKN